MTLKIKPSENTGEKGEHAASQRFSPFNTMFPTLTQSDLLHQPEIY